MHPRCRANVRSSCDQLRNLSHKDKKKSTNEHASQVCVCAQLLQYRLYWLYVVVVQNWARCAVAEFAKGSIRNHDNPEDHDYNHYHHLSLSIIVYHLSSIIYHLSSSKYRPSSRPRNPPKRLRKKACHGKKDGNQIYSLFTVSLVRVTHLAKSFEILKT